MVIQLQRMTATEFMALPVESPLHELINGEEIMSPTPPVIHQRVAGQLLLLLNKFATDEVLLPLTGVYLDEFNIPAPDLLWISANSTTAKITEKYIEGTPDLIVEIFSLSTTRRDKKEKFQLYEKYGVREYWMVDPVGQYVEMWRLDGAQFVRVGVYGPTDDCTSPLLGKKVDLTGVFPQ